MSVPRTKSQQPRRPMNVSFVCLLWAMACLTGCSKRPNSESSMPAKDSSTGAKASPARPKPGSEAAVRHSRSSQIRSRPEAAMGIYAALARKSSHPIAAKIQLNVGAMTGDDLAAKYMQFNSPLPSLPVWKRKEAYDIRLERQTIFMAGDQEAESVRGLGAAERRAWTNAWQDKHREKLKELNRREHELLQRGQPPAPGRDQILGLLDRLREPEPPIRESDLVIIESLLPDDETLNDSRSVLNEETLRLLEAHRMLAERFPQSASRGLGSNALTTQ
jgi:hypothetical protein